MSATLTDRQQRERDYHRKHAAEHRALLDKPFSWDVIKHPDTRWWNAYWTMYACIRKMDMNGKRALVVGCGFGDDALRLARLGARVSAFDLSPESLEIARALTEREGLAIDFAEMPAERMKYPDSSFDLILARDILHHVDIPIAMAEIVRVAKPDAVLVINEVYSHSFTDRVRGSALVEKLLYPRMRAFIYGDGTPYITDDERKLDEVDLGQIKAQLGVPTFEKYFNFMVTRVIPDRFVVLGKLDRLVLGAVGSLGRLLAGRVLFGARVVK